MIEKDLETFFRSNFISYKANIYKKGKFLTSLKKSEEHFQTLQRRSHVNVPELISDVVNKLLSILLAIERLGFYFQIFDFYETYFRKRILQTNFMASVTIGKNLTVNNY